MDISPPVAWLHRILSKELPQSSGRAIVRNRCVAAMATGYVVVTLDGGWTVTSTVDRRARTAIA
jgi:hypothetical protein